MTRRTMKRPDVLDEGPSEEDLQAFGDVTRECPACKSEIYDDVAICWKCGHALTRKSSGPPKWVIGVVLCILLAFVLTYFLR